MRGGGAPRPAKQLEESVADSKNLTGVRVMVIDDSTADAAVITGSYNWTYAAQYKNAENVLILRHNPDVAHAYAANWRRHRADALPYAEQ